MKGHGWDALQSSYPQLANGLLEIITSCHRSEQPPGGSNLQWRCRQSQAIVTCSLRLLPPSLHHPQILAAAEYLALEGT